MTDSQDLADLITYLNESAESNTPPEETPNIGVIMGSDSDLPVMRGVHDVLTEFGFEEDHGEGTNAKYSFESFVVSAHRTPELLYAYGDTAADRGLDIIIAGAGGKAADLPNMTASIAYPIPVIGIPVQEKSVDSVLGMPTGAPILVVDAGNARNAALSAIQIFALKHPDLETDLNDYHTDLQTDVATVSRKLHTTGTDQFSDATD